MARMSNQHRKWAKLGAAARIAELHAELASIYQMFPDLKRGANANATPAGVSEDGSAKKRRFSSAGKKAISQGMREYWARRKALAAKNAARD